MKEKAMTDRSKSAPKPQNAKPTSGVDNSRGKRPSPSEGESGVGRRAELLDHERAVGRSITYADDRLPMQSAPDHGPHK
jgi:hypothetical protein